MHVTNEEKLAARRAAASHYAKANFVRLPEPDDSRAYIIVFTVRERVRISALNIHALCTPHISSKYTPSFLRF